MSVFHSYITDALQDLRQALLYRERRVVEGVRGPYVKVEGREVLCFCSNDYLGIAQRPELAEAAAKAAAEFGWGSGASRLLSGTTQWHARLEEFYRPTRKGGLFRIIRRFSMQTDRTG